MPLTSLNLHDRLLDKVSPGNATEFYELLTEADELLLNSGRWVWTRAPLDITVVDGLVILPDGYKSICGCRIGSFARGVLWQDIEYLEDGPGLIEVQGTSGQLLDQGVTEVSTGVFRRTYLATSDDITEVAVLARYEPLTHTSATTPRCQSFSALKKALYALLYESANDLTRYAEFLGAARVLLTEEEAAYRGVAKKIRKPSLTMPLRRRSRSNFP